MNSYSTHEPYQNVMLNTALQDVVISTAFVRHSSRFHYSTTLSQTFIPKKKKIMRSFSACFSFSQTCSPKNFHSLICESLQHPRNSGGERKGNALHSWLETLPLRTWHPNWSVQELWCHFQCDLVRLWNAECALLYICRSCTRMYHATGQMVCITRSCKTYVTKKTMQKISCKPLRKPLAVQFPHHNLHYYACMLRPNSIPSYCNTDEWTAVALIQAKNQIH